MKEFIKNKKVTYNLMSFTGFKALVIFSLLTNGSKSYAEISDYMENHPYLREKISIDTLRVYINSLKRIGCEIKRTRDDNKISRYEITAHPFELKATPEQLNTLVKIYKNIIKNIEVPELLYLDNFFEKIGKYIKNTDFIDEIKSASILKNINKNILEELLDCCNKKLQIVIKYNSPNSGIKNIEILTDKLEVTNGKLYLYGITNEYKEYSSFLVSRIKNIEEIKLNKTLTNCLNEITVTCELSIAPYKPEENEKIIKQTKNNTIIEIKNSNKFLLKQKLLEFGPQCKILAPEEFKNEFIELLKDMKAGYYCD